MTPILSKSNGPGRSQRVSRISPYHTTSSGPGSQHPLTGHVTDYFCAGALNAGDVYLCGAPERVESGRPHVAKLGASTANVHFEKFAPASEALAV
jgi:benzoate/toluate 1,2-dioxygenase reductase subunit